MNKQVCITYFNHTTGLLGLVFWHKESAKINQLLFLKLLLWEARDVVLPFYVEKIIY